jgi:flagellar export protein FliJ
MSQFHFRLATLLKLRETTRDECRVQLAEAHRADAELKHRQESVAAEQTQLQLECRTAAGPGAVDLRRLIEAGRYACTLRHREEGLHQERQTLAVEIDRRHEAVMEADREVRTLEKLRDHQAETHRQEAERQDGKRLDDAALQTAGVAWSRGDY